MEDGIGFEPMAVRFCKPFLWTAQAPVLNFSDSDLLEFDCQEFCGAFSVVFEGRNLPRPS